MSKITIDDIKGQLYTPSEAARMLGVNSGEIKSLIADGKLPAAVIGSKLFIWHEDLARVTQRAIDVKGREELLLKFIIEYKSEHDGNSPSIREIIAGAGFSSTSMVNYYLDKLEQRGRIVREAGGQSRGIKIPGGQWVYQPGKA